MRLIPQRPPVLWVLILLFGLGSCKSSTLKRQGETLVLTDASLVDPRTRTLTRGTLVIRAGKVAQILAPAAEIPDAEHVISLKGKYLLPGLIDLHSHVWGNGSPLEKGPDEKMGTAEVLRRALYCGVIAVLDLGSQESLIIEQRNLSRRGEMQGALLFAVGPVFGFGEPGKKGSGYRGVRNPAEAQFQIMDLAKSKPDLIKILYDGRRSDRENIDENTLKALIATAHGQNLRVIVHIGTWKNAEIAARAKADVITHFFDDEIISPEALRAMKEEGVISIPTLAVQTEMGHLAKNASVVLEDPLLKQVSAPWFLDQYRTKEKFSELARRWVDDQDEDEIRDVKTLKQLARAGVPLLAGSDGANFGVFQGFSVHREIELWVQAGVSIWDALAGATTKASELLGIKEGFRPGDDAHFVILSRSPLEDIRHTRSIEGLVFKGRIVDRALLTPRFF